MRRSRTALPFLGAERCRDAVEAAPSGPGPGAALGAVRRRFSGSPLLPPAGLPVGGGGPGPRARGRPGGLHHRGERPQQRRRVRASSV
ncbi:unnamed protein product, partial [Bubo scandiacus]